ncbi:hypothetical protein ABW19_dt0205224 [Dactylella cylindrospora]|nr:hypothetical protein ABW19_dt0205224 [Dactylella cylindrospora]
MRSLAFARELWTQYLYLQAWLSVEREGSTKHKAISGATDNVINLPPLEIVHQFILAECRIDVATVQYLGGYAFETERLSLTTKRGGNGYQRTRAASDRHDSWEYLVDSQMEMSGIRRHSLETYVARKMPGLLRDQVHFLLSLASILLAVGSTVQSLSGPVATLLVIFVTLVKAYSEYTTLSLNMRDLVGYLYLQTPLHRFTDVQLSSTKKPGKKKRLLKILWKSFWGQRYLYEEHYARFKETKYHFSFLGGDLGLGKGEIKSASAAVNTSGSAHGSSTTGSVTPQLSPSYSNASSSSSSKGSASPVSSAPIGQSSQITATTAQDSPPPQPSSPPGKVDICHPPTKWTFPRGVKLWTETFINDKMVDQTLFRNIHGLCFENQGWLSRILQALNIIEISLVVPAEYKPFEDTHVWCIENQENMKSDTTSRMERQFFDVNCQQALAYWIRNPHKAKAYPYMAEDIHRCFSRGDSKHRPPDYGVGLLLVLALKKELYFSYSFMVVVFGLTVGAVLGPVTGFGDSFTVAAYIVASGTLLFAAAIGTAQNFNLR